MDWQLGNSTPYAATTTLAADRYGHDIWLTVVKATFDLAADGGVSLAAQQMPIVRAPVFAGDPARSSLLAESDIDYAKGGVDVLVQGSVQVPNRQPRSELVVGLEVDGRRKLLQVCGERFWTRRGLAVAASEPMPFTTLPLAWEHAFGGFDPLEDGGHDMRNPAGCGHARDPARLLDRPAPQIVYLDEVNHPHPRPAGFGPVARHWQPRAGWAGTYDQAWQDDHLPLLPTDFDERFFLAAPADQQFQQLQPHALIRLAGMSPWGALSFRVPRLALGIHVRIGREEIYRRPVLRTVLVLPDPCKLVLTYADAMPCTGAKYRIEGTELIEKRMLQ